MSTHEINSSFSNYLGLEKDDNGNSKAIFDAANS
jgi:hypothetical protein